jgi:hypothetical protein
MARSAHRPSHAPEGRPRSRRRRIAGLAVTALAVGAVAIPGGLVGSPAAQAADAIDCSAIYAMNSTNGAGSTLWSIDTDTGTQAKVGEFTPGANANSTFNGLGVGVTPDAPAGQAYAMRSDTWTVNEAGAFETFDFATGSTTSVNVTRLPATWTTTQSHGAADPQNSRYLHGNANGGILTIDSRDIATGQREGRFRVDFGANPAPGPNGDIALDRAGNMYIVMSGANDAAIYVLDANDVAPAATEPYPTARARMIQTFTVADAGGVGVNGIAFDRDGYLNVSTGLELIRVNPMSGEVTSRVTFSESGVVDLASCSAPSHLTLEKDFPEGRESGDDTDQVRLTMSGSGLENLQAFTTGTDAGVQSARLTAPVLPGAVITIGESGTGADPTRYRSSWSCVDGTTGTRIASGAGTSGEVTVPLSGSDEVSVRCTFTNTPRGEGEIALTKSADASHAQAGDLVTYSFDLTNIGTSDLSDVTVDETGFTGVGTLSAVDCPSTPLSLAVGETVTCTATYSVQQGDVDRGSVENSATAAGTTPTGVRVVSPPSSAIVRSEQTPALAIVKSTDAEWFTDGSTLDYLFEVTNTGNVTLTDVRVDETAFTGNGTVTAVVCPAASASLAPGESMTCTATYAVEEADLALDTIDNTAVAAGNAPGGGPVESDPSTATTPRGEVGAGAEGNDLADADPSAPDTGESDSAQSGGALADTGLDTTGTLVAGAVALALLTLGTVLLVRRAARRHQA